MPRRGPSVPASRPHPTLRALTIRAGGHPGADAVDIESGDFKDIHGLSPGITECRHRCHSAGPLHLVTLTQVYSPDGWYESVEDLEQTERNFEFQSSRALALVFIPAVSHLA